MTQQWLDYYTESHHTVALLSLANMPRQIAWCKWFTWNKGLSHDTCGVATIIWANRNHETWDSKTKTFDLSRLNVPRDFTAEPSDWRCPPETRENNTNQARKNSSQTSPAGQETSQRATFLWYSFKRWDLHQKRNSRAGRGVGIKRGKHTRKAAWESGEGRLNIYSAQGGKVSQDFKLDPFEVPSKAAHWVSTWQVVQFIKSFHILRTMRAGHFTGFLFPSRTSWFRT